MKSKVYLAGAGPGDCGLITLKAFGLIRKADCIIYDYLVNTELLDFAPRNCQLIYVGKKAGAQVLSQEGINRLLVRQAKIHHSVVRLKGGDPFIFGRGAEEALYLKKKGIAFEIIPGVTSAIAVPAYAGIPLTVRSENSTVGFITGHEDPTKREPNINWPALVRALGTMVFLMGGGNLPLIVKRLIECKMPKTTPVALIRWGTTARQKTVTGNLGNIVKLSKRNRITPPAIIVVGKVINLRRELNWFEKKPLFGKRIIVTRTREQASLLSERLSDMGAEVIEVPTIKIVPLNADRQLRDAFLQSNYDWIFFTSQNGVIEFARFLDRIGRDSRIFAGGQVCAIGTETAKSLGAIGIKADYVPSEFRAEAIVSYFKNKVRGKNILILRARKARSILPEGLEKSGAVVKIINLYDTCSPKESAVKLKEAFKQKVDFITFTSSSTVENSVKLLGRNYRALFRGVKIASIGPITSRAVQRCRLKVNIEAKVYTINGLVAAIVKK